MKTKITAVFLVAALAVSILAGGTKSRADIAIDIAWFMDKPGIYRSIPDMVRRDYGDPSEWIKSGAYSYEFLDKEKQYITIRHIDNPPLKLEIPAFIDGHKVIGVGCWGLSSCGRADITYPSGEYMETMKGDYNGEYTGCIWDECKTEEIVLPEGIEYIGTGAFATEGSVSLKKVDFPKSLVYIGSCAFDRNAEKLRDIHLPEGVYVDVQAIINGGKHKIELYSDCDIREENFDVKTEEVVIRGGSNYKYEVPMRLYRGTDRVYLDKKIKEIDFQWYGSDDYEYVEDEHGKLLDDDISSWVMMENLYVNGKNTKVLMDRKVGADAILTVPDAKVIKLAQKHKTTYIVKETGNKQEVKGKKKAGLYKATWKKVKTVRKKTEYKKKKKKWTTKSRTMQTEYKVYGKKKKNGTYKLLKTTTKNSIKSEYKYIKAVPVKTWDWK